MLNILTKTVMYVKDGLEISVCPGTLVIVDMATQIALIGEDHVYVFPDEYTSPSNFN